MQLGIVTLQVKVGPPDWKAVQTILVPKLIVGGPPPALAPPGPGIREFCPGIPGIPGIRTSSKMARVVLIDSIDNVHCK